MDYIIYLVPLVYSISIGIEFIAFFCNASGYIIEKPLLASAIRNVTLTLTRASNVLLLPIIGYLVDKGVSSVNYVITVLTSYFLTAITAIITLALKNKIIDYYIYVINNYSNSKNIILSMLIPHKKTNNINVKRYDEITKFKNFKFNKNFCLMALISYGVLSIGFFTTFLLALKFPENRVMITQLSGVINAVGILIWTMKIEPGMSFSLELDKGFINIFYTMIISRIFIYLLFSPTVFLAIYFFAFYL